MTSAAACYCGPTCTRCSTGGLSPSTPDTWSIQIAPELRRYPALQQLDGQAIQLPEDLRPQRKYIQEHATAARASWK